jgi:hypothetical protein
MLLPVVKPVEQALSEMAAASQSVHKTTTRTPGTA